MRKLCGNFTFILTAFVLLAFFAQSALGAAVKIQKSVIQMEEGKYLIKLKITSATSSIYALKLSDPKASILDVYAPRGWCIVTDGEDFLARTLDYPIRSSKTLEFIIHSSTDDIHYTWAVFGRIKQIGKLGSL